MLCGLYFVDILTFVAVYCRAIINLHSKKGACFIWFLYKKVALLQQKMVFFIFVAHLCLSKT